MDLWLERGGEGGKSKRTPAKHVAEVPAFTCRLRPAGKVLRGTSPQDFEVSAFRAADDHMPGKGKVSRLW